MRKIWLLAALLVLAVAGSGIRAQAAPGPPWPDPAWATADRLDRFVAGQMEELGLPGLVVVVIADGEVLFEGAYGEASFGVPTTLDTPFRLGSTSKQFTGLAVQQLIAQGRLGLDTTVGAVLHEFTENDAWSATTVRHLLAHRSGLSVQSGYDQWSVRASTTTLDGEVQRLAGLPLTHPAGTTYEYSNANYTLLGAIIERVTGLPFEAALQELVARPLGLASTTSDLSSAEGLASEYYTWFGRVNVPTPAPASPVAAPSAYVTSTARDLTTLLQAHLEDPSTHAEVLGAARQPLGEVHEHIDYASGWHVRGLWELTDRDEGWDHPDRPPLWEHHGGIARAQSYLGFSPESGLGVVALTNTGAGFDEQRWTRFSYDLVHEALGTQPLVRPVDPIIRAAPVLIIVLPILQLLVVGWLTSRRLRALPRRWVGPAVGSVLAVITGTLAFVILPGRTGLSLLDPVWMTSAPDLAFSLGLQLLLSAGIVILIGVRLARRLRRQPTAHA